jgi:phosphatidylinositol-bisphosphatase
LNSRRRSDNDPNRAYIQISYKCFVDLMLCVFVKAPHKDRVKCVQAESIGVGVMGMMGNRGGVSVRFEIL